MVVVGRIPSTMSTWCPGGTTNESEDHFMQKFARIGPIAFHLPETVEDNDFLKALFPKWDMELIYKKTGVRARHIAAPGETAADLAVVAAEKLFQQHDIDRDSIDFLLLCTQSPDYPLPTTACLLQDRLKLRTSIGALDFNLGCSGYVYGLSLADGLIRSGAAKRILLLTAETYSKYIHPTDRSLRTIFGDGAAATLIEAADEPSLGGFVFGTDGRGADTLMVAEGGARPPADALQPRKRKRWPSALVMDGPELVKFTLDIVPPMIQQVLEQSKWTHDDVEFYLVHQATLFMLEHLRLRLNLAQEQMPLALQEYGNTVSSTLPLLMHDLRAAGRLRPGTQTLLIGFGVGLSWAACSWTDTWLPRNVPAAAAEHGGSQQHPESNGKGRIHAMPEGKRAADAVKAAEGD
jgi:3-oxoacyl-[acyl-carrier-protein] synthase-3